MKYFLIIHPDELLSFLEKTSVRQKFRELEKSPMRCKQVYEISITAQQ
jgi:hypothetical protein